MKKLIAFLVLLFCISTAEAQNIRQILGFEEMAPEICIDNSVGGSVTFDTVTPITGVASIRMQATGVDTANCRITSYSSDGSPTGFGASNLYTRITVQFNTLPPAGEEAFFTVSNIGDTPVLRLRVTSAGLVKVYDITDTLVATGTTVLSPGIPYIFKIYSSIVLFAPTSPYEVIINDVVELSGNANQGPFQNIYYIDIGKYGDTSGQSVDFEFDDIVVDDTQYPAPGKVLAMLPIANGIVNDWLPDSLPSCYQELLERPPDNFTTTCSNIQVPDGDPDTSYAATVALQTGASAGISGTINGLKLFVLPTEVGAIVGDVFTCMGANSFMGSPVCSDTGFFTNDFLARGIFSWENPDTLSPWAIGDLNLFQGAIGTDGVGDLGNIQYVTVINMSVDFDAPPTPTPTPAPSMGKRILSLTGAGK